MNATKSLIAAEEGVSPAVRQLARQSRRAGPGGTVAKVRDEGGLTNLEVQAAGGEEGRATSTGLQVTSDALSMNSELQVAGGGECRTDYGSTAMPRKQRLELGKLLSEQIAMLELLVEDFGH